MWVAVVINTRKTGESNGKLFQARCLGMIPVFFRPEMVASSRGFSPSPGKPGLVVEAWRQAGIPIEVRWFEPSTVNALSLAHDQGYVEAVLACEINNGHGNTSPEIAATLPYTCGSMVAALNAAVANGVGAVSPTSGFHHAGYDFAGGFCTFNGLMVAALSRPDLKVGILDFDMHRGNGTEHIIASTGHRPEIVHYTQGRFGAVRAQQWLGLLAPMIRNLFRDCDVVLYQAGQDPHVDDPLGGWLTTEQLMQRDYCVFEALQSMGIPVAWNLAGGYQTEFSRVIQGHVNTMIAFSDVFFQG